MVLTLSIIVKLQNFFILPTNNAGGSINQSLIKKGLNNEGVNYIETE